MSVIGRTIEIINAEEQTNPAGKLFADHCRLLLAVGTRQQDAGLPSPRAHHDLGDLSAELQAELGPLLVRVERAVASISGVGRVHVCRWGDGGAHFHVWFIARPERLPQLKGSFLAIWDDILPPLPEALWRQNLETVAAALRAG